MVKKKTGILKALCITLCMTALWTKGFAVVRAEEQPAQLEKGQTQMRELSARGNIVYQDGDIKAGIYAADFALLYEKAAMGPKEAFDPACYTHIHQWEYRDPGERTHTRHCAICGDAFDLVEAHKAEREDDCMITREGKEFPGRRYSCACGYQWEREKAHVLTFDVVDETCHRSRCLLDGTEYCMGYEPVEEEHYAFYHTPDQTGTYYIKTCIDCGYQTEEAYEPEEKPDESGEETAALELEEEPEGTGEAVTLDSEEEPEGTGEEAALDSEEKSDESGEEAVPTESDELSEETTESGTDKRPGMSVSGNDCTVNAAKSRPEESANKGNDERGENL